MASRWTINGTLGDGEVHMNVREFIEHRLRERYEKENRVLLKLANNPVIDESVRMVVWKALRRSMDILLWRKAYIDMRKERDELKRRLGPHMDTYEEITDYLKWKEQRKNGKHT